MIGGTSARRASAGGRSGRAAEAGDRVVTPSRLLISDYGGHPFTYELAVSLVGRVESIDYSYCASTVSPKGRFDGPVAARAVGSRRHGFEKYRPWRRLVSELDYGLRLAREMWQIRPDVHVLCNMPLVAAAVVWAACVPMRARLVVWFQDVQSGLATASLRPGAMTSALSALETFVLRRARRVIANSELLARDAARRGVPPERVGVLENWAPVHRIPVDAADSPLDDLDPGRPLVVYAGTLGRKHDPLLLLELADGLAAVGGHLVVVAEGEGTQTLTDGSSRPDGRSICTWLPFQPFDVLPSVLARADVLVAVLEPEASPYSVPSKVLTYLCAGRPVVASMPTSNPVSELITDRARAGIVLEPDDRAGFVDAVLGLAADPEACRRYGESGRRFAEQCFAEEVVVDRFLHELSLIEPT